MTRREATHAGTWYSSNKEQLTHQLKGFLDSAKATRAQPKVIIGPHAGYSYSGSTLAESYACVENPSAIRRIFLLGPSHHVFFEDIVLTTAVSQYATPLGNIPVDKATIKEIASKNLDLFKKMTLDVDQDEHSLEMHLPMIRLVFGDTPIVPLMISHNSKEVDFEIAKVLLPYFKDPHTLFIVSSDFCHWGSRFRYTKYCDEDSLDTIKTLSRACRVHRDVWESIEFLDKSAMDAMERGYDEFQDYLDETGNTVCGQKPIGVILALLELADTGEWTWIGYKQSSKVTKDIGDSSVSYVSGFAV